jgi:molybdate transport system substrate-binding protein
MQKIILYFLLCCIIPLTAFAQPPKEITVSAAISLKNVFEELGKLYEAEHGVKCTLNFASSGALVQQIAAGAPVDIFASAAQKDMNDASKQALILEETRVDFAANSIVMIVPSQMNIPLTSFEGLNTAAIQKIALGNPQTVPAGRYAEEVLNFYQLIPAIEDKFIYTENVRQALDYVALGEVDAGFVYGTDASTRTKEVKVIATAPEESHQKVIYPIALVKDTKNKEAAEQFIAVLLSDTGNSILEKYGFKTLRQ